jgi:hypothetical protein
MLVKRGAALALSVALVASSMPGPALLSAQEPQGPGSISGHARREVTSNQTAHSVRARGLDGAAVTVSLDAGANYAVNGLTAQKYVLELLSPSGKIMCTEQVTLTQAVITRTAVEIECGKKKALLPILLAGTIAASSAGLLNASPPASAAR